MSILKYTNSNGEVVAVNTYKVNNVIVVQETGLSENDVMSQKSVTEELDKLTVLVPSEDYEGYYEFDKPVVLDMGEY